MVNKVRTDIVGSIKKNIYEKVYQFLLITGLYVMKLQWITSLPTLQGYKPGTFIKR